MKNLVLIFTILPILCFSQKHDNHLVFGLNNNGGHQGYGTGVFEFETNTSQSQDLQINFQETISVMSDSSGNLLYYSNGIAIGNAAGEIMENGLGINSGSTYYKVSTSTGMTVAQSMVSIPNPQKANQYLLFHLEEEVLITPEGISTNWINSPRVFSTKIDMSNGAGEVIEKNKLVGTGQFNGISATKHGNGRDWWIVMPSDTGGTYYTMLVDAVGSHPMETTHLYDLWDIPFRQQVRDNEANVFTPDGTKFINYYYPFGFWVIDFDRCSGTLSNPQRINLQNPNVNPSGFRPQHPGGGAAISPNSRFLYINNFNQILQYDLTASNISASGKLIAEYDGFQSPWGTQFYLMQLMPDGKIYINCGNSENVMHVINQPDLEGVACDVQQHAVQLPVYNIRSMPYFPNYRLMDWADRPCDTLGIDTPVSTEGFAERQIQKAKVFPNPTSGEVTIEFKEAIQEDYQFVLHNAIGQQVFRTSIEKGSLQQQVSLPKLASGIYYYGIGFDGGFVFRTGKLVLE